MKKIAVFNQKGGVGKTITSINLASTFSKLGKKVLVVDCDGQGNSTSCFTNISEMDIKYTLADCIEGVADIRSAMLPVYALEKRKPKQISVDILPCDGRIDDIVIEDGTILRKILSEIETEYDFAFFDCPPQKTDGMLIALCAADYVLVPAFPEIDSISGYSLALDLVNELRLKGINETIEIIGIVINNISQQRAMDRFIYSEISENYKNVLLKSTIRNSTVVVQAKYFGMGACYYKPNDKVSKEYEALAKELLKKIMVRNRKAGI